MRLIREISLFKKTTPLLFRGFVRKFDKKCTKKQLIKAYLPHKTSKKREGGLNKYHFWNELERLAEYYSFRAALESGLVHRYGGNITAEFELGKALNFQYSYSLGHK